MKVEYVDHMGDDLMVVNAARVSFAKHKEAFDSGSDGKLIDYLAKHGHWTPFGHPTVAVRVTAPIFVARQLYKHKVGFVENEESRRYVDELPEFWFPETWRKKPTDGKKQGSSTTDAFTAEEIADFDDRYSRLISYCENEYRLNIELGMAPEQARAWLPQSMYTQWYWTGSLASFSRVYGLRADPHAQAETREIAYMIDGILSPLFPVSWEALCGKKETA